MKQRCFLCHKFHTPSGDRPFSWVVPQRQSDHCVQSTATSIQCLVKNACYHSSVLNSLTTGATICF